MKNNVIGKTWVWFLIAVTAVGAVGCKKEKGPEDILGYSETAERRFEKAMDEFNAEDCVAAEPAFEVVRKKFPYSRFAALAELRIADCRFNQGENAEAAVAYREFVKAHPTNLEAHYAAFRQGLSHYDMIPGDWVIMPPSHERDQASTRDARDAFQKFLSTYKDSPFRKRATDLLEEVEDALVRHEMFVANFYLTRDDRRAAVVRLEGVRSQFPGSKLVPDAMFLQALTFIQLNEIKEARRVFNDIITYYPKHYQRRRAEVYLQHLDSKGGGAKRGDNG